jgi:hypothetical protein
MPCSCRLLFVLITDSDRSSRRSATPFGYPALYSRRCQLKPIKNFKLKYTPNKQVRLFWAKKNLIKIKLPNRESAGFVRHLRRNWQTTLHLFRVGFLQSGLLITPSCQPRSGSVCPVAYRGPLQSGAKQQIGLYPGYERDLIEDHHASQISGRRRSQGNDDREAFH